MKTGQATQLDLDYVERTSRSAALFDAQKSVLPGGLTHSSRAWQPHPLFVERCRGSYKWDADGNQYVDYWMGHGSAILGHAFPSVVRAVQSQAERGFHASGETELGLHWAHLVHEMVPSAELVRFTACGGEATQLAMRLARAATGKDRIVKFEYNFHGWHDTATVGMSEPMSTPVSAGVPTRTSDTMVVLPFNDAGPLEQLLVQSDDIAGIIIEAGGPIADTVPVRPEFLHSLRALASRHQCVLIFDEVVTGFRYARGGVQEYFGVLPDLTALGKILGGGLSSGAVAGKTELLDAMSPRADSTWMRFSHVPQQGTWNANPMSAASGIATLEALRDGSVIEYASRRASDLKAGLNDVLQSEGVEGLAYGRSSIWKLHIGPVPGALREDAPDPNAGIDLVMAPMGGVQRALREAMLLNGIDLMRLGGYTSSAHSESDIERTVEAFRRSIRSLLEARILTLT